MFKKRKLQGLLAAAMVALLAACGGGGGGGASGGVSNGGGSGNSGWDASSDAHGWGGSGSVAGGGSTANGGGSSAGGTSGGAAGVSVTVGSGGGGSTTYSDGINDLNWSTMNFKVFVNGNLVFDQPISKGDQISMKGVKVGDKIHAEGSFLVAGETEPRTVSGDIPSASGNDKLTLYVGYKYSYPVLDAGGNPTGDVETGLYTAANPPSPPNVKLLDGRKITGWVDGAGNPVSAGTTGDLSGLQPVYGGTQVFEVEGTAGSAKITGLTDAGKAASELTIPEGVTEIADNVLSANASLAKVTLPESVTSITSGTFAGCASLQSVEMPGLTEIPANAFSNGTPITTLKSVYIPNVTKIKSKAFNKCTGLESIDLSKVTSIGLGAFENCALESADISSASELGNYAFAGCAILKSVKLAEGITEIPFQFLQDCTSLASVTIPGTVTTIGNSAFNGCTGLASITIPESVTTINATAFNNCNGLINVTMKGEVPPTVTGTGTTYYIFKFTSNLQTIYVPSAAAQTAYEAAAGGWSNHTGKYAVGVGP